VSRGSTAHSKKGMKMGKGNNSQRNDKKKKKAKKEASSPAGKK
jgi:hypothetical protein